MFSTSAGRCTSLLANPGFVLAFVSVAVGALLAAVFWVSSQFWPNLLSAPWVGAPIGLGFGVSAALRTSRDQVKRA